MMFRSYLKSGLGVRYACTNYYKDCIDKLNQLTSNRKEILSSLQFPPQKLRRFEEFISLCGIDIESIEKNIGIMHVAGTKGKGSVCAYSEIILRKHGYKTGFYSSPHLISVRERIRINGEPISECDFAMHFLQIYELLRNTEDKIGMPGYFEFLTIVALKVFLHEKVDVAILEVGIGGEFDCTNIFSRTNTIGITSLGYDHTAILGNTWSEIAWQKSGIMKQGTIAITSSQQPTEAIKVLNERALEKKCMLFEAPPLHLYHWNGNEDINMGIRGPSQGLNLSLGLQLANAFMNPSQYEKANRYKYKNTSIAQAPLFEISEATQNAICECTWLGRAQILKDQNYNTYYIDGAHTIESIQQCVQWFEELCPINAGKRVLVFTMTGKRDFKRCLNVLAKYNFNHVCFTPKFPHVLPNDDLHPDILHNSQDADESIMITNECYEWWKNNICFDNEKCIRFECVEQAMQWINGISGQTSSHVLVTGSLHLVGSVLYLLRYM